MELNDSYHGFPANRTHVLTECSLRVSSKCKTGTLVSKRSVRRTLSDNNGSYICMPCSRRTKSLGRNNSNTIHKDVDDSFFSLIDSEEKSYLLGLIASDGSLAPTGVITITLAEDSLPLLVKVSKLLNTGTPQLRKKSTRRSQAMYEIRVCSTQMVEDVCKLLSIQPGKKDKDVGFPMSIPQELYRHFIRGYFDGDGSVGHRDGVPRCDMASNSSALLQSISELSPSKGNNWTGSRLEWSGVNALDFLDYIYRDSSIYLSRKKDKYYDICTWSPSLDGQYSRELSFRCSKTSEDAVFPYKERASDSGYDLTLIDVKKQVGPITWYGTGIKVQPPFGYYFDMVPRSSLSKTGYMLANSVGVIDRAYTGEIIVPLIKTWEGAGDLELPFRAVQLIPRTIQHFQVIEGNVDGDTARGERGFGSSG